MVDVQVAHSDEEWHQLLTPAAYRVLRQAGTELPFSSPLEKVGDAHPCLPAGSVWAVLYSPAWPTQI